jgi:hypothetical protein
MSTLWTRPGRARRVIHRARRDDRVERVPTVGWPPRRRVPSGTEQSRRRRRPDCSYRSGAVRPGSHDRWLAGPARLVAQVSRRRRPQTRLARKATRMTERRSTHVPTQDPVSSALAALALSLIPSVRVELELWRGSERPLGRALSQKAGVRISATSGSGGRSQSPRTSSAFDAGGAAGSWAK